MKRFCLALDLNEDLDLIKQYISYHQNVWPEIINSIKASGITGMEIYNAGNRLFMIMETKDDFSFEEKARADASNPMVRKWERLMEKFQKRLPFARENEKWVVMEKIFELH